MDNMNGQNSPSGRPLPPQGSQSYGNPIGGINRQPVGGNQTGQTMQYGNAGGMSRANTAQTAPHIHQNQTGQYGSAGGMNRGTHMQGQNRQVHSNMGMNNGFNSAGNMSGNNFAGSESGMNGGMYGNGNADMSGMYQRNGFDNEDLFNPENFEGMNSESGVGVSEKPVKPKMALWKKLLIGVGCLVIVLVGGSYVYGKFFKQVETYTVETAYKETGRYALDEYVKSVQDYNASDINDRAKTSWVSQEWDFANDNKVRESWIRSICSYVKFEYPQAEVKNNLGKAVVDSKGNVVFADADMTGDESIKVTVVDYNALAETMKEDLQLITDKYKNSGYHPTDYTYTDEMTDLMIDYLLEKNNFPTKQVEIKIPLEESKGKDGKVSYIVKDDAELDKLLFSSDEFHGMLDTFGTIIYKFDNNMLEGINAPTEDEATTVTTAPAEVEVKAVVGNKDEAKTTKKDSKSSEGKGNSKSKKDKGITTTTAVPEVTTSETTTSQSTYIDDGGNVHYTYSDEGYEYESVITYTWVGAYYCRNEYKGKSNPEPQEGDGSFEAPAGIGTTVVTKVLGTDGKYHDCKVTMKGYWVGQDAIDYAVSFSEKNRGMDSTSVVKLICFEFEVQNLESAPFTAKSEIFLADSQSNPSSRSGSIFGFYDEVEIQPKERIVMNDWATSTELDQKYVCWGKTFQRQFNTVWFKLLAGSGEEVKPYDANKTFINRDANTQVDSGTDSGVDDSAASTEPVVTTTTGATAKPEAGQVLTD